MPPYGPPLRHSFLSAEDAQCGLRSGHAAGPGTTPRSATSAACVYGPAHPPPIAARSAGRGPGGACWSRHRKGRGPSNRPSRAGSRHPACRQAATFSRYRPAELLLIAVFPQHENPAKRNPGSDPNPRCTPHFVPPPRSVAARHPEHLALYQGRVKSAAGSRQMPPAPARSNEKPFARRPPPLEAMQAALVRHPLVPVDRSIYVTRACRAAIAEVQGLEPPIRIICGCRVRRDHPPAVPGPMRGEGLEVMHTFLY